MSGPLPTWLAPIARLGECVYRAEVARRNARYDRGIGVTHLPVPVISVGNLSVGGTGKTPMALRLLGALTDAGRRPALAMRGYAKPRGVQHSDEELQYRNAFPRLTIVAQPDRLAGLRPLLAKPPADGGPDVVVLDDGFQHRSIARGLDIVMIDAERSPFTDRCLPAGWLREPVSSLRRAHAVVINGLETTAVGSIAEACQKANPSLLVARATRRWTSLIDEDDARRAPHTLRGARVLAMLAIGHPGQVVAQLRALGASHVQLVAERDHHPWTETDLARASRTALTERCDAILTTEKDWTKLAALAPPTIGRRPPILRPVLALEGDGAFERLLARAKSV
ncbi:MAG: tetraacyldisaccharide 4'-kinase [Phycisphaerales bacterium]|nr:tetraacyldisaccharide 4'-kinase [Phycisphaerales bacterium]